MTWKDLNGCHVNTAKCSKFGVTEDLVAGRRGDVKEHGEILSSLRKASKNGHLFIIPGAGLDGGVLQLAGDGREPLEGVEELSMVGGDNGMRGHQ